METSLVDFIAYVARNVSPLAGDINWMETLKAAPSFVSISSPHSLGTLIEWKRYLFRVDIMKVHESDMSPLAGDINWMETYWMDK